MDRVQHSPTPSDATMTSEGTLVQENSRSGEFPCQDCGKILSRRDALVRHSRTAHGSGSHFWCQERGCFQARKGFRRSHDYRKHMRTVHNIIFTANSMPSQRPIRRNPRQAIDNGHNEVVDQASPQVAQQPVAQSMAQAKPQPTRSEIPQTAPQYVKQLAPEVLTQTPPEVLHYATPNPVRSTSTYVPQYSMYNGQPVFQMSNLPAPLHSVPVYVPVCISNGQQYEITLRKVGSSQLSQPTISQFPVQHSVQSPPGSRFEKQADHPTQKVTGGYKDHEERELLRLNMMRAQNLMIRQHYEELEQKRREYARTLGPRPNEQQY